MLNPHIWNNLNLKTSSHVVWNPWYVFLLCLCPETIWIEHTKKSHVLLAWGLERQIETFFWLGNGLHLKWELGKCDWMASNWVLLFFNVPKRIHDKATLKKKDAWIGGFGIEYRTLKSSGHLFPCIRVKIDSVRGILGGLFQVDSDTTWNKKNSP